MRKSDQQPVEQITRKGTDPLSSATCSQAMGERYAQLPLESKKTISREKGLNGLLTHFFNLRLQNFLGGDGLGIAGILEENKNFVACTLSEPKESTKTVKILTEVKVTPTEHYRVSCGNSDKSPTKKVVFKHGDKWISVTFTEEGLRASQQKVKDLAKKSGHGVSTTSDFDKKVAITQNDREIFSPEKKGENRKYDDNYVALLSVVTGAVAAAGNPAFKEKQTEEKTVNIPLTTYQMKLSYQLPVIFKGKTFTLDLGQAVVTFTQENNDVEKISFELFEFLIFQDLSFQYPKVFENKSKGVTNPDRPPFERLFWDFLSLNKTLTDERKNAQNAIKKYIFGCLVNAVVKDRNISTSTYYALIKFYYGTLKLPRELFQLPVGVKTITADTEESVKEILMADYPVEQIIIQTDLLKKVLEDSADIKEKIKTDLSKIILVGKASTAELDQFERMGFKNLKNIAVAVPVIPRSTQASSALENSRSEAAIPVEITPRPIERLPENPVSALLKKFETGSIIKGISFNDSYESIESPSSFVEPILNLFASKAEVEKKLNKRMEPDVFKKILRSAGIKEAEHIYNVLSSTKYLEDGVLKNLAMHFNGATPLTSDNFHTLIKKGVICFRGIAIGREGEIEIKNKDLSELDLTNTVFNEKVVFKNCTNLHKAKLRGAQFNGGVAFIETNYKKADFTEATAKFVEADVLISERRKPQEIRGKYLTATESVSYQAHFGAELKKITLFLDRTRLKIGDDIYDTAKMENLLNSIRLEYKLDRNKGNRFLNFFRKDTVHQLEKNNPSLSDFQKIALLIEHAERNPKGRTAKVLSMVLGSPSVSLRMASVAAPSTDPNPATPRDDLDDSAARDEKTFPAQDVPVISTPTAPAAPVVLAESTSELSQEESEKFFESQVLSSLAENNFAQAQAGLYYLKNALKEGDYYSLLKQLNLIQLVSLMSAIKPEEKKDFSSQLGAELRMDIGRAFEASKLDKIKELLDTMIALHHKKIAGREEKTNEQNKELFKYIFRKLEWYLENITLPHAEENRQAIQIIINQLQSVVFGGNRRNVLFTFISGNQETDNRVFYFFDRLSERNKSETASHKAAANPEETAASPQTTTAVTGGTAFSGQEEVSPASSKKSDQTPNPNPARLFQQPSQPSQPPQDTTGRRGTEPAATRPKDLGPKK